MVQRSGPRDHPNRRVSGRLIATTLTVVCVSAALASCGTNAASGTPISVLPSTAAQGGTWRWSSACRVGPHAPAGCAASGPELAGHAQLAGNEWNLGAASAASPSGGSVTMSVNHSGGLRLAGDLSSAPPCTDRACVAPQANTWVRGYPSILYGIDQCNAPTSPHQSAALRLPMRVGSIPGDLIGTSTYVAQTSQITHDVAYDLWLNASDTRSPCQTQGTLEVMIWTDYDAASVLPPSMKVGTTTIPSAVNGRTRSGNGTWSVYADDVYAGGRTAPWGGTVWLVPDAAQIVRNGSVSVDLSGALVAVGTLLQDNYGWSDFRNRYWLDTIAFGLEYGPPGADPYGAGPTRFSLDLSSYCLDVGATVAAAAC